MSASRVVFSIDTSAENASKLPEDLFLEQTEPLPKLVFETEDFDFVLESGFYFSCDEIANLKFNLLGPQMYYFQKGGMHLSSKKPIRFRIEKREEEEIRVAYQKIYRYALDYKAEGPLFTIQQCSAHQKRSLSHQAQQNV